jgi:hypothetical protein
MIKKIKYYITYYIALIVLCKQTDLLREQRQFVAHQIAKAKVYGN